MLKVLSLEHYKVPQLRKRVLLRGLHKVFSPTEVPPVLPPFGSGILSEFLALGLPTIRASSLTPIMQSNLKCFVARLREALQAGKLCHSDIVVLCLDRAEGKTYAAAYYVNRVPTLTT